MYKLIIFDLDGTLLDTSDGILKSIKSTLEHFKLPTLSDEDLQKFIGPPIQDSLVAKFKMDAKGAQMAADYFRKVYSEQNLFYAKPYEGIYDLCQYLVDNKILVAVATFKREDYAIRLLSHFKFDKYSNIFYGGDNLNTLKKVDIIKKCISKCNVQSMKDILMVGDTLHDSLGSLQVGIDFLAVTYGFGFNKSDDFSKIYSISAIHSPLEVISCLNH